MAGSRFQKLGTIFSRTSGLLKSGAMKEESKPIWYNIYEAFPPHIEPCTRREKPKDANVINILYPEDFIRARFYREYGSPGLIDMNNGKQKSLSQVFIEKYIAIARESKGSQSDDEIFAKTEKALFSEGIALRRQPKTTSNTGQLVIDLNEALKD